MNTRRFAVLVLLIVLVISGPSRGDWSANAAAAPTLTDLSGVDELKILFNRDAGKVRLVLLVSPT